MDRSACRFVEALCFAGEYFACQPAEEHEQADCRCEAKQQRQADELKQTLLVCRHHACCFFLPHVRPASGPSGVQAKLQYIFSPM